ncbi:hypothetical protein ACFX1S_024663 [Malus domestica]
MHKVLYQFHLKLTCNFELGQVRYKPYSRSPPNRQARRFAERCNRQGKQSDFQASNLDRRFDFGFRLIPELD